MLVPEPRSEQLLEWLLLPRTLYASDWTVLEVWSALGGKVRSSELSAAQAHAAGQRFERLLQANVRKVLTTSQDIHHASLLCSNAASGLRAGDALHVAVAQRIGCSHFFSLDKVLNRNAREAGLLLVEP